MSYQPYQPYQLPYQQPPSGGGKAIASLVLGVLGLLGWCIPLFGLPMTITGLILGINDMKSRNRGMAIAGVVLCSLGLALSLVNAGIGAYLGATGRNPVVNQWLHQRQQNQPARAPAQLQPSTPAQPPAPAQPNQPTNP